MADDALLDGDFLRKLEALSIAARRAFPGTFKGEKRSPHRGSSVEFADFRNYAPGDDFRHIDWNVYGRLEKLFLKLFVEEEDLHVYLLLDVSKSMGFGDPKKIDFVRRLAAAVGYIALTNLERVGAAAFSDRLRSIFPPTRGRHEVHRLFDFLRSVEVEGETNFEVSLRQWTIRRPRPGVAFVISDFFDTHGFEPGLLALLTRRFDVNVIHVVDDFELNPDVRGDLRLVDVETGDVREITVSSRMLSEYQRSVAAFGERLRGFCRRHGIGYVRTSTSAPFEDVVLREFRRGRFVE